MAFSGYNGAVVSSPFGKPSLAYVVRTDVNQIAAVDTLTDGPVDFAVYHFHPFTGEEQNRNTRKRIIKMDVFGEGVINPDPGGAYIVVIADESRVDVYPYAPYSANPSQQSIWTQNFMNLPGRQFDIVLLLTGTGLKIREAEFQFTIVG